MLRSLWNQMTGAVSQTASKVTESWGWTVRALFQTQSSWDLTMRKELRKMLLSADFGPVLSEKCLNYLDTISPTSAEEALEGLYSYLFQLLSPSLADPSPDRKDVYLIVGVNGAGKTTTSAKMTYLFQEQKPLLIAADTYRAAAIAQLAQWAERLESACFISEAHDPSAVTYEGLLYAQKHEYSPVIVDTSGRLQTDKNLLQELVKIKKTALKVLENPKRLKTILVLDGTQGQNILHQVETFHQALSLDALILTKMDGHRKSGILCAVLERCRISVDFIGLGERPEDLIVFDLQMYLKKLLGLSL